MPVEFIVFTVLEETEASYIGKRLTLNWKESLTETLPKELWHRSVE